MKKYNNVEISEIVVDAKLGAELDEAIKECMVMAIEYWQIVKLTHNERVFVIDPNKMQDSIQSTTAS